jgi:RNA polymerase sigma-70 factor, ECF subfamily
VTVPASRDAVSDGDLIRGWRRERDDRCAAELVRRHGGSLSRFLAGAGASLEDLEDLVQETFFRAFRRIETFKGRSSFRTWLMTIGSNVMRDAWRRRQRRPVVPLDDRELPDETATPDGMAAVRDLVDRLAGEVARLPAMQRDVFLLRAQQGLDYGEIAAALETTSGAARVHYHHAVKRLKRALGDEREGR